VAATLGILKAGGAYLPLDPEYPEARLHMMLEDSGTRMTVAQDDLSNRLPEGVSKCIQLSELNALAATESSEDLSERPEPTDLAYVMYTSGSTGDPKGVCVEHRNVLRLVCGTDYARFDPEEVFLQYAPTSFDASTFEIWGALLHGSRLAVAPPGVASLDELGRILHTERVTTLWLTAGLFHHVVEDGLDHLSGIRQLLAGGDVLSPRHVRRVLEAFPGICVINGYGPTECTTFACCHPMRSVEEVGDPVPIGRPIENTTVYVLDSSLQSVPSGDIGELYIGGDGVARGYLNRPELTTERFLPDPFAGEADARMYRTGDEVRQLPDGTLAFLGRRDRQVKIRGFRVELDEIEIALQKCDGVAQAAVIAYGSEIHDARLAAYVTARNGQGRDTAMIEEQLRRQLPAHMVPSVWIWLDSMPLTSNGKVDRAALPEPVHGGQAEYEAPETDPEQLIAAMWQEILGAKRVGRADNFFSLGGHSIAAMRLACRLRDTFGVHLPVGTIFGSPTIVDLAEAVEEALLDEIEGAT
jgi:amino acid adenylation domain-containing protein